LFFFSSRRRHTRFSRDWSSDVCSSDLSRFPHFLKNGDANLPRKRMASRLSGNQLVTRNTIHRGNTYLNCSLIWLILEEIIYLDRSEERRVGKECRWRVSACRKKE